MAPRYGVGQKVTITPVKSQQFTPRDVGIEEYTGLSGKITDFYWINLNKGEAFFIYSVQIKNKEIVVHEDEIEPCFE